MSNIRVFKRKISHKMMIIVLITILVISSFIIINKYDLISRAINFFATINNGYTEEVKSVEIKTIGYDSNQEGALKITKSAEWTGLNEATVKIKVESNPIEDNKDKDIIFLLDISSSIGEGEVLTRFQNNFVEAYKKIIDDSSNNRVAFFSFATKAKKEFDFTRDKSKLETSLQTLKYGGSTNYYYALKEIEQFLNSYTFQSNKELHLIIISDGSGNEGRGSDEKEYNIIKEKWPNLIVDYIDTYPGDNYDLVMKKLSDRQYYDVDYKGDRDVNKTMKDLIVDAALSKSYYSSIDIQEYINSNYFEYISSSSYYGTSNLVSEGTNKKIVWNLNDSRFKSGYGAELKVKLKLKDPYQKKEAYLPTSSNVKITASHINISSVSEENKETPVLKSWYEVSYQANIPEECSVTYSKKEIHYPFESVSINGNDLVCSGWSFKGWEISDIEVKKISSDSFTMPVKNINIGAMWTKMSVDKSMEGTIDERATLYEIISSSESKPTEENGVFTYSSTQNYQYPIRYFKGVVDNNNVIFANKCWKIVRTTNTGGIKMLYNGPSTSGSCVATGENTTIGKTEFYSSSNSRSIASAVNYTYSNEYPEKYVSLGTKSWSQSTTWIYGNDVTYSNGIYTLKDTVSMKPYYYGDYIETLANGYHYTCMTSGTTCSTVKYVYADRENNLSENYIELSGGKKIEDAVEEMVINPGNNKESLVKTMTDTWYANNMTSFTYMLEDTVWCNSREILSLGSLSKDGNSKSDFPYSIKEDSILQCRKEDSYTVSKDLGNGYLKYPVGQITDDETRLAGKSNMNTLNTLNYLYNGVNYWTMSPIYGSSINHYTVVSAEESLTSNSNYIRTVLYTPIYVRPAVSLKPGVFASSGNGTPNNPYIIEME